MSIKRHWGKSARLVLAFSLVFVAHFPSGFGYSVAPLYFQGTKQVLINDLIEQQQKASSDAPDISAYTIARLHQIAYARKSRFLTVELYGFGQEVVRSIPDISVDPIYDEVKTAKDSQEETEAQRHLEEAIKYFTKAVEMKRPFLRDRIGGLQESSKRLKVKAFMGLIWSLHSANRPQEAANFYPKLMSTAKNLSPERAVDAWILIEPFAPVALKPKLSDVEKISADELIKKWDQVSLRQKFPYAIWAAKAQLHGLVYLQKSEYVYVRKTGGYNEYYILSGSVSPLLKKNGRESPADNYQKYLQLGIALYEKVLNTSPAKQALTDDYPWQFDFERMSAKVGLARLISTDQPIEKILRIYGDLLDEAIVFDQRPDSSSGVSIAVWRTMRTYLDPVKDAKTFEEIENKIRNAKVKGYLPSLL